MPDIVNHAKMEALKEKLKNLARFTARSEPHFSDAILDVLTAADYEDKALLESSVNAFFSCVADIASKLIQRDLDAWEATKEGIRQGWREAVNGVAFETVDGLKSLVDSIIGERLEGMKKRQNMVKKLEEKEYPVENATKLEAGVNDLMKFREDMLANWPSAKNQPSPINQKALSEMRDGFARGETGMSKDKLVWGNRPTGKKT